MVARTNWSQAMTARFFADIALLPGTVTSLPERAARHVQVLRLQPGEPIVLFNGKGNGSSGEGEFVATISSMGRSDVQVSVGAYSATRRETGRAVGLAICMPANERMDWLVEKATELGVSSIQPLVSERSVLRITGERADKKLTHWRGIAEATCEQCGRNLLPVLHQVAGLREWLRDEASRAPAAGGMRLLLSLQSGAAALAEAVVGAGAVTFLSGPEGGLTPAEEAAALACGFAPVSLGPRVLRADTAPLACLAFLALLSPA